MKEAWLKCDIFKGMFSDERAVKISQATGAEASFFVPETEVDGAIDQQGRVRVSVFKDGSTAWAVLPTEYRASVPVKEADLTAL